jgi:hypothetical protein
LIDRGPLYLPRMGEEKEKTMEEMMEKIMLIVTRIDR